MIIDKNKIQLKYIFNVYKTLKSYPTKEDFLYDCILQHGLVDEDIDYKTIWRNTAVEKYGKEKYKEIIDELLKDKCIEKTDQLRFNIIKTPWSKI